MTPSGSTSLQIAGAPVSASNPVHTDLAAGTVTTLTPPTAAAIVAAGNGVIDATNSSTATLAGDAVFTGAWVDVLAYVQLIVRFSADVAGICYFESSNDGANITSSPVTLNASGTFAIRELTPTTRYYRLRYVNGSAAQATFALTSRLNRTWATVTNSAAQTVSDTTRATLVRQITDPRLDEALSR